MTNTLAANEVSHTEVVVDNDGTIWVSRGGRRWRYVTDAADYGWLSDDYHDALPVDYEPYLPLDPAAEAFVRRHLGFR